MKSPNDDIFLKYKNRFIKHLLDWGFFYLLLIIFFTWFLNTWVFIGFSFFILYYIYNRFTESITYMTHSEEKEDSILIEYFKFSKGKFKLVLLKRNFTIEWYDWTKGNIKAARLIIKNNDQIQFIQYAIGRWNRKELEKIYKEFKKY